jgi:hypothetical protein
MRPRRTLPTICVLVSLLGLARADDDDDDDDDNKEHNV